MNTLIINNQTTNFYNHITKLLQECESFTFNVAFVNFSGIQLLLDIFEILEKRNIKGKILTSTYLNFTQIKALEKIKEFKNIELKIYDSNASNIGFHSKSYIFEFKDNYKILIGSSNITASAFKSNIEWNVKTIAKKGDVFLQDVLSEFENLWIDSYEANDEFLKEYADFLNKQKKEFIPKFIYKKSIKTNFMQEKALEKLEELRVKKEKKALVIAATGSGKTYLSAFDVKNFQPKTLLFLVHRENILLSAKKSFETILGDNFTYGLYTGNKKEEDKNYIFSTIQTMTNSFSNFSQNHFDYIIIDEAHHVTSPSYKKVIEYFKPKFLLGLTATSNRMDGNSIYEVFDENIACDIRLNDALEHNLVVPFHYFGISDIQSIDYENIDLNKIDVLAKLLSVNTRADFIIEKMNFYSFFGTKRKAIGFCVSKEHAFFMSEKFNEKGINSLCLTSEDSIQKREETIKKLEDEKDSLEVIFTVDIFNEGIDIPSINTVLFLRPTNSPIVFVQQLGRGLRKDKNKDFLTVLDFIGNHKKAYLIALSLVGNKAIDKESIKFSLQNNFADFKNAFISMDEISKNRILKQIENENFNHLKYLKEQYFEFYLINKIVYKEVLDPSVTNIITNGGDVTFNIQIDEDYPPQGSAKAIVSVNGIDYEVVLNATGRGTLTIDSAELGDLSKVNVIVKEIIGGNYEKVNLVEKDFDFTPIITIPTSSNDAISTNEDETYTLKVTDFGEVSVNTTMFKITELPTNGKLFLTITIGDTIFNPDGTQTVATQNTKVEITENGQIISLAQIGAKKVEFVPNKDSDIDGSFNFQVGDGKGNFSNDYTTTINVDAIADKPTASINITKVGATTIVVDGNTNGGNSENNSNIKELELLTTEKAVNDWGSNSQDVNDNLTFTGTVDKTFQNFNNGSVTTGDGNDILRFASVNNGKVIHTGSGDDKVIFNQDSNVALNLGNGNNEADFVGGFKGTLASAEGNDKVIVKQSAEGSINLGAGNNTISVGEVLSGSVATGSGDDTLIVGQNVQNKSSIDLGDGNNTISIGGTFEGSIVTGIGSDKIIINENINGSNNSISTGAGNDFVQIHGEINNQFAKVDLGEGDDGFRYEPTNWNAGNQNAIDGGKGFDTLYLNGNSTDYYVYTKDSSIVGATFWKNYNGENLYTVSWENFAKANEDSEGFAQKVFYIMQKNNIEDANRALKVTNFESISFGDKIFGGKDNSIKAVEYKVDIGASLTDRDGSETLSVVIKNVPTVAILESSTYEVSKNSDGSYTVKVPVGIKDISDSLTLKVPRSYKEEINLEIEAKATETNDNKDFAINTANGTIKTVIIEPFNAELDMDISEATIKVIETKDVNKTATEQAGIKLGADGKYYKTEVQSHTEKVVNTEALKNLQVTINDKTYTGITVGADGKYYVIDNTIAKEQKTIEVEREVTKTVELESVDSFMIEVTKETKGIVLGKEVTDLGTNDTIAKNNFKTYRLEQPTSNIEIKLASGSAKLEFVDANGKVIGSSTTQTGTDSKGYSVPKDAVGVKITSTSTSLKIDAIKYHVDPHEETVQVGGKILDVESMQKAGITWNSTVSETKNDTSLSSAKIGSTAGDGNITGFNPEVKANSQVFDFGKDKAYQLVTIKVDVSVEGTWNFSNKATKDVFVVSANGVPQGAYNYSSEQDSTADKKVSREGYNVTDIAVDSSGKGSYKTIYEYKVYLDENGKVQMNFVVASTNKDEIVNIKNITVNYEGLSGFVQTKTEIEKVTETIFVGVPTNTEYKGEVPTKDIIKYENVEVETTPIYTKVTQYEYVLDLNATITKGNGELSEVTLEKLPDGVKVQSYEANEDGSYTIKIGEDGKAKVTLVSDTLISPEAKQEITSSITATSQDKHQISNIEVNIDEKEESNQVTTFDGEGDIDLTSIIGQYKVNYIDLENGKANDIKLNFDEILADDKEIYIKGDDKDSISLNSELWKEAESTNVDGVKYNVYTGTNSAANSTIKLLIDDDIQVNHDI